MSRENPTAYERHLLVQLQEQEVSVQSLDQRVKSLEQNVLMPVPMLLWCPECGARHVDRGEFMTKPHHTHACQKCGMTWRPALCNTVGVQFLPGFKDPAP